MNSNVVSSDSGSFLSLLFSLWNFDREIRIVGGEGLQTEQTFFGSTII
jgi:hypothetical protein